MRGVKSEAMLLAASLDDKVEVLQPPADCKPGDKVFVEGYEQDKVGPPDEQINPKKEIFEQIQPDLTTTSDCIVTYRNTPLMTAHGVVTVKSLASATVR